MPSRWVEFVTSAIRPEPDDPHVRLLREKIAAGCRPVRVNIFFSSEDAPPEYLVVLSCEGRLSEMRIPHSPSFLRWSLETGARLESAEEEAKRFRLVLDEGLIPLLDELGEGYFNALLVHRVRELGMPRSSRTASRLREPQPPNDLARARRLQELDDVFASVLRDIGRSLGYSEEDSADIFDGAMEGCLDRRFQLTLREKLFGR